MIFLQNIKQINIFALSRFEEGEKIGLVVTLLHDIMPMHISIFPT